MTAKIAKIAKMLMKFETATYSTSQLHIQNFSLLTCTVPNSRVDTFTVM